MEKNKRKAKCKKKKICCKFVGAGLRTRPQKGITLIALIITVIVMLILVGVTINVALNGDLFEQTQTAAEETQIEADREQLLSAVVGAIGTDAKVDFSKLDSNLPYGWTGYNGTYTSPKGNVFTVDEKGNITSSSGSGGTSEEDSQVPEELAKYILGQDLKGRVLTQIFIEWDIDNYNELASTFIKDPEDSNSTIHEDIKLGCTLDPEEAEYDEIYYVYRIRYGRDVYEFKTIWTDANEEITAEGSLKKLNSPDGNLGKYVKYQGITWIVLYDEENKVELISADVLGKATIDTSTVESIKEAYNNAVKILTDACKEATGITKGIRNVGGPDEEQEPLEYLTLNYLTSKGFEVKGEQTELEDLIENIRKDDNNYLEDFNQMLELGILIPDKPERLLLNFP